MTDIADLGIRIRTGEVERAQQRVRGFAGAVSRLAAPIAAMAGAGLTLSGVARTNAEFGASMARVGAVSRATADDMAAMEKAARQLGGTTEFSAAQAAGGMQFLAQAGFNTSEILGTIPTVLDLATASSVDMATAGDLLSNIMGQFGIETEGAAGAADILAASTSRSNTDLVQLAQALTMVGPVAAGAGMSLEQTAATIGILSNNGIQASMAGTALRSMMLRLRDPADDLRKELEGAGLALEDIDFIGEDVETVMSRLADAGFEATDMARIFGTEAAAASGILFEQAGATAELADELSNAEGQLSIMAARMRDTFTGDVQSLQSAFSELSLELGETLMPIMRSAVQGATDMVRGISGAVDSLGDMFDPVGTSLERSSAAVDAAVDAMTLYEDALRNARAEEAEFGSIVNTSTAAVLNKSRAQLNAAQFDLQAQQRDLAESFGGGGGLFGLGASPLERAAAGVDRDMFGGFRVELQGALADMSAADAMFDRLALSMQSAQQPTNDLAAAMRGFDPNSPETLKELTGQAERFIQLAPNLADVVNQYIDAVDSGDDAFEELAKQDLLAAAQGTGMLADSIKAVNDATAGAETDLALQALAQGLIGISEARDALADDSGVLEFINSASELQAAVDEIADQRSKVESAAQETIDAVNSLQPVAQGEGEKIGQAIGDGILSGIAARQAAINSAAASAVQGSIDAAKLQAGIQSPSKVFAGIGDDLMRGLGLGIERMSELPEDKAARAMGRIARRAADMQRDIDRRKFTLGMSDADKNAADNLFRAADRLGGATPEAIAIADQVTQLDKIESRVDAIKDGWDNVGDSIYDSLSGAKNMGEAVDNLKGAGLNLLDQWGQKLFSSGFSMLGDSLISGAMGLFGGGGGGVFGGLGSLFAGFFDGGGQIPAGKIGMVGERGPELIPGPATVTSRVDTARMMQSQSPSQMVIQLVDKTAGGVRAIAESAAVSVIERRDRAQRGAF